MAAPGGNEAAAAAPLTVSAGVIAGRNSSSTGSDAPARGKDPGGVSEALRKVQLLDHELAAADQRAAAVAAAGRALEQRIEAEESGGDCGKGSVASEGGSLAAAMQHARRRLQREAQLKAALNEHGPAAMAGGDDEEGTTAESASNGIPACQADEALLETLLNGPAASAENPFSQAAGSLAAIDAKLAALGCTGHGAGGGAQVAAPTPPALDPACAAPTGSEDREGEVEEEFAAIRQRYIK